MLCSERFASRKAGSPRAGPKAGPAARPGRGAGPAAAFFPPAMRGLGDAEACSGKKLGRFCPPRWPLGKSHPKDWERRFADLKEQALTNCCCARWAARVICAPLRLLLVPDGRHGPLGPPAGPCLLIGCVIGAHFVAFRCFRPFDTNNSCSRARLQVSRLPCLLLFPSVPHARAFNANSHNLRAFAGCCRLQDAVMQKAHATSR